MQMEGMEDPFNESWHQQKLRIKKKSQYSGYQTYELKTLIVKANDDLRQELLAI